MLVVDAGVVVVALVGEDELAANARAQLTGTVHAPELLDLEVGSVLRRLVAAGRLTPRRAAAALGDLHDLPVHRESHRPLLRRCWELRGSVTFYDAAYVALADVFDAPLLTTDARLSSAPGPRCEIRLLS